MTNASGATIIKIGMLTIRPVLIALIAIAGITLFSCGNPSTGSPYDAEGSEDNPVDLGDPADESLIYTGEVDTTVSLYQVDVIPFSSHPPGYHITLTDLLDDADLLVSYDNVTLDVYSRNVGKTADEELDAFPSGAVLYIAVDGTFTEQGTTFTLTITKN